MAPIRAQAKTVSTNACSLRSIEATMSPRRYPLADQSTTKPVDPRVKFDIGSARRFSRSSIAIRSGCNSAARLTKWLIPILCRSGFFSCSDKRPHSNDHPISDYRDILL